MNKKSENIKSMFNKISPKYDFLNNVISLGLHKFVKKISVEKLKTKPNSTALDLCTGTGDIAFLLSKNENVKSIVAIDFSEKMIDIANKKNKNSKINYICSDCTNLTFNENTFDICTISFGLRNIPDKEKCLNEIARVLKNDGIFMHLDFLKNTNLINKIFELLLPLAVKIFYKENSPYKYLINSKQKYLDNSELKKLFEQHGLILQSTHNFLFNTITLQICKKP